MVQVSWRDRRCRCAACLAGLVVWVVPMSAQAAEWEVEPFVRASETWTDNVELSADDEEDDFVTAITPGVRVSGDSARAELDLRYQLRNQFFAEDSDRNSSTSLAAGQGEVELIRQRLFLEGDLTRTEQFRSADGVGPTGGGLAGGSQREVTTAGIAPRLEYEFGRTAGLRARHRREYVDFDDDRETETDLTTVLLTSGPAFVDWGWNVNLSRRKEDTDDDGDDQFANNDDIELQRASVEVNYQVAPSTQLFGVSGREDNTFRTEVEGDTTDGSFWEAGFRWRPQRRVALEAAVGERFFGDTARGSLRVQGRSLDFDLSVSQELVTTSSVQVERSETLVRDPDGNLVIGPDGDPVTAAIGVPTIDEDVIEQNRVQARVGWSRGHSDLRLSLIGTDREFLSEGTQEDARQADLDWTWNRLARTTVTAGIGYAEQEFEGQDREDDTRSFRLGATRDLARNVDVQLDYRFFARDSTIDSQDYTSNRIRLAIEATF